MMEIQTPRWISSPEYCRKLLRLTTLTSLDFSHYCTNLCTLLDFLTENKSLEYLRILCRKIVSETPRRRVSLPSIRDAELSSLTVLPVLERLCLPHTANINIQISPGTPSDPPLRDILPQSLDGLPGIAQTIRSITALHSLWRRFSPGLTLSEDHSGYRGSLTATYRSTSGHWTRRGYESSVYQKLTPSLRCSALAIVTPSTACLAECLGWRLSFSSGRPRLGKYCP